MRQPLAAAHHVHKSHEHCSPIENLDIDALLGRYDAKPAMGQLLMQLELGKRLGEQLLTSPVEAQALLTEFKVKAPTKTEVVLGKANKPIDDFKEEPTQAEGLMLLTANDGDGAPEDIRPITVINEHVRMGVYFSVVKTLMKAHGSDYAEYAKYRDRFGDKMTKEFADNDRARKTGGDAEAATKILTHADFNDRLERRIEELILCLRTEECEKTRTDSAPHLFVPSETV